MWPERSYLLIHLALLGLLFEPAAWSEATLAAYAASSGRGEESGIYRFDFNTETGVLESRGLAIALEHLSFLAYHPSLPVLYALSMGASEEVPGSLRAYSVDAESGQLNLLREVAHLGKGPCHLSVEPQGRRAAVANYTRGNVAILPLDAEGLPGEASEFGWHAGHGQNPKRQDGAHIHCASFDATGRFLLCADLGLDKVFVHNVTQPMPQPAIPVSASLAPGAGPRHLVVHPNGRFVHVVCELNNTVTTFGWDGSHGILAEVQTVSTLPPAWTEISYASEIQVHPNGRFLYVSNRGHDSIACFQVDPETGLLTLAAIVCSGGKWPHHFALDPTGGFLLSENENSDQVSVMRIDKDSGVVAPIGACGEIPKPVCLVFAAREKP